MIQPSHRQLTPLHTMAMITRAEWLPDAKRKVPYAIDPRQMSPSDQSAAFAIVRSAFTMFFGAELNCCSRRTIAVRAPSWAGMLARQYASLLITWYVPRP